MPPPNSNEGHENGDIGVTDEQFQDIFGDGQQPPTETPEGDEENSNELEGGEATPEEKKKESHSKGNTEESEDPPLEGEALTESLRVESSNLKTENESLKLRIKNLETVELALQKAKSDPSGFVADYLPALAKYVQPDSQIKGTLQKEFGADFTYDPSEAYTEGTDSYKFRVREQELRDSQSRQASERKVQQEAQQSQRKIALEKSKLEVMKRYNLTEEQFQEEIVKYSQTKVIDYSDIALLKKFPEILKKAVADALKNPKGKGMKSPARGANAGAGSEGDTATEHLKEFADAFGETY